MLWPLIALPTAAAAAYAFVPKVKLSVDSFLAKFKAKPLPGTAPGTTSATTAPPVNKAPAPAAYTTTDFDVIVTLTPVTGGWRPAWKTPDGRTDGGAVYTSQGAAEQAALDMIGQQFVQKPWPISDKTAGKVDGHGTGVVFAPTGTSTSSANLPPIVSPGASGPALPRPVDLNDAGPVFNPAHPQTPPPGPGAQVIGIPTLRGGVNVYVEADPDSPGNFKATYKLPPGDGAWVVATGATLQAAADSAATSLAVLVR